MKTINKFFFSLLFIVLAFGASAQTDTYKLKVAGECGMCKKTIEKAAKTAGASFAAWDADAKMLTVKYAGSATNLAKIEKAVAEAGYDTQNLKASDETYNKLHECCKYERTAASDAKEAQGCCGDKKCTAGKCSHDGKCKPDMTCCKDAGCDKKDCCKKGDQ
jgi:hypothetical protein